MIGLDPDVLGWQEFWLRMGVLAFTSAFTLLLLATVVKLTVQILTGLRWVTRKARGRGLR